LKILGILAVDKNVLHSFLKSYPSMKIPANLDRLFASNKDLRTSRAVIIRITGLVQGVGFRPHVYRMAMNHGIEGWVNNTVNGVHIKAVGKGKDLVCFLRDVVDHAPPVAEIKELIMHPSRRNGERGFHIIASTGSGQGITDISPDIAVCSDCLNDMQEQPHRINYPLINCTNCGPRFSIIRDIPYDRLQTSMAGFTMCSRCSAEYHDILDRRFHAQPVACNICGPEYALFTPGNHQVACSNLPEEAARLIDSGLIVALKGSGGFHLVCNDLNRETVIRLRTEKLREGKPFAVMFPSTEAVREFALLTKSEELVLNSWRRPVVLLKSKKNIPEKSIPEKNIPEEVNSGLNTIGAILPYMPFHYLMFRHLKTKAIILTSGNLSQEPIITDRWEAIKKLGNGFDFIIDYNREIVNRTDDPVVHLTGRQTQIIRRSRAYAPGPVWLAMDAEGILATGGELKNCFCIGKGNTAIMSQYIGDLKNLETFSFFCETVEKARRLFRFEPAMIATDLHPDFLTAAWSRKQELPIEYVQHHHAHIASCLAEHRLNETVVGLGFDGTGYGTDGHIWGSEIMRCNLQGFERLGHLEYLPMPGGDKAIEEPWRMALGCLYNAFGKHIPDSALSLFHGIDSKSIDMVQYALGNNINITQTSGIGRLFDAVASLLGLCHVAGFDAEGPMRLEACIDRRRRDSYPVSISKEGIISVAPVIEGILHDLRTGKPPGAISARFHNFVVEAASMAACKACQEYGIDKVVLSGGTFQNRYLLFHLSKRIKSAGMQVLVNRQVPANDGGIALGQLAVAAARKQATDN